MKKVIFYIIFLIIFIVTSTYIFYYIFYPAHISMIYTCNAEKFEEDYSNYKVSGRFNIYYNETNTKDGSVDCENKNEQYLEIYVDDDENLPVLKHELCHLKQFNQHRLFTCKILALRTLNEAECYSIQRFYEVKDFLTSPI